MAISKIEVGLRGVSVDEWLQLAHILAVPPPLLLLDLEAGEYVQIAPAAVLHPWLAWEFITGAEPPILSDRTVARAAEFGDAKHVINLYRFESKAADAVHSAKHDIRTAEFAGNKQALQAARTRYAEALQELSRCLTDMTANGVEPPQLPPEWVKTMKRLGILPEKVLMFDAGADEPAS